MKPAFPTLFWLSLIAGAFAAEPQPRARLVQSAVGVTPQVVTVPAPEAKSAVVMDKFVVRDAPLTGLAPRRVDPEPEKFTLLGGGPVWTGKLGSLPVAVGMWTPIEIMPETAKFRPQKTHAEFDFLRIKF